MDWTIIIKFYIFSLYLNSICADSIDNCINHNCKNLATCIDGINSYTCKCPQGFTGRHCEEDINECKLYQPCRNKAPCKNSFGSYQCECFMGWTGKNCSVNVDDCSSSPCLNGGKCIDKTNSQFDCQCTPGFVGHRCEYKDPCNSNPCHPTGAKRCSSDFMGRHHCECKEGYIGTDCRQDFDECSAGERSPCAFGKCVNTPGSFHCVCDKGYEGPYCESDIRECEPNPCQNGGTCLDKIGKYVCACYKGFSGTDCEEDIDECKTQSPCQNGGRCINSFGSYRCECPPQFMGRHCESRVKHCDTQPCENGGKCMDFGSSFDCSCAPGFSGSRCEINVNDCVTVRCQNQGVCVDGVNTWHCKCPRGYKGKYCEMEVDACATNPCRNGGQCLVSKNGYTCSCAAGTSGEHCEHSLASCLLESGKCLNGGKCITNGHRQFCSCQPHYSGPRCEHTEYRFLGSCSSKPCQHSGNCTDLGSGLYSCQCPHEFSGPHCDRRHIPCELNHCQHDAQCENIGDSFRCLCPDGYQGARCESNIDECSSNPCGSHGNCVDQINRYECHCHQSWTGRHCDTKRDLCQPNPCSNGALCSLFNRGKSYKCDCDTAFGRFTGHHCTEDIDECQLHQHLCKNNGECINTAGSYVCRCPLGYTGRHCEQNINDCVSHPCRNGGHCVDGIGAYTCQCQPGFFGIRCELEEDECNSRPCENNGSCVDHINSYTCKCRPGFSGRNCEINDNDCSPSSCINGGICHDLVRDFRCECQAGYSGRHCEVAMTPCDKNPCNNNGTCVIVGSSGSLSASSSTNQAFRCDCLPGYTGPMCDEIENLCLLSYCGKNSICQQNGVKITCKCSNEYSGERCHIAPNLNCFTYLTSLMSRDSNRNSVCFNGGHCYDAGHSIGCSCPSGYTGDFCEINVDDCASHPCKNGAQCVDKVGIYQCKCQDGYQGKNCEHRIDMCKSSPCVNRGKCINLVNDYHCVCPPGTSGRNCEIDDNECHQNKCENGAVCVDRVGGYSCLCPAGFTGRYCEADINECQNPRPISHTLYNLGPCYPQGSLDCHQLNGQFKCLCKLGYIGRFCNVSIDLCSEAKDRGMICSNGGKCVIDPLHGNATCVCPSGYSGPTCRQHDIACQSHPCQNGGVCRPLAQPHPPYRCECPVGLGGLLCEVDIVDECRDIVCENEGVCVDGLGKAQCVCKQGLCGDRCEKVCPFQSPTLSICEEKGNCVVSKPWSNCSVQNQHNVVCSELSYNGVCDPVCNTESCLFDGWDCLSQSSATCPHEEKCSKVYGDDVCNQECNSKACQYDGGDCLTSPGQKVAGKLILILETTPNDFIDHWMISMTRSLSALLKTTVRLLFTKTGQPEVEWYKSSRAAKLTKVSFEIDNSVCRSSGSPCFEQASSAAEFISAALTERKYSPPLPIVEVESTRGTQGVSKTPIPIYIISGIVCCVIVVVLFGVLFSVRHPNRKIVKAKTWFPGARPGDSPDSSIVTNQRTLCFNDPSYMQLMPSSNKTSISTNQRPDTQMTSSVELQSWESGQALIDRMGCDSVASTESHCSLGSHHHESGQRVNEEGMPPAKRIKSIQCGLKTNESSAFISGLVQCLTSGNGLEDCPNSNQIMASFVNRASTVRRQSSMEQLLCSSVNSHDETLLHIAASYNRSEAARKLMEAGGDPNLIDSTGRTPLLTAIDAGALETARVLLSNRRTDVHCRSNSGATPLIHAVKSCDISMLQLLLEVNIPEETYLNLTDNEGRTALHWAAITDQLRMMQFLLLKGCNKDAPTKQDETPLFLATKEVSVNCCKYLLSSGASLDLCDQLGRSPKSLAAELGNRELLSLFEAYELHSYGQLGHNIPYNQVAGSHTLRCHHPPNWTQTSPMAPANVVGPQQQSLPYWQHSTNNLPPSVWSVTSSHPMKTPSIDSDSPGRWDSSPGSPGTFQPSSVGHPCQQQVVPTCHSLHNPIYSSSMEQHYYPYQYNGVHTSSSDHQNIMQTFAYPDRLKLEPKLV